MTQVVKGACMCGAVNFSAPALNADVHVCHCSQCRAWSGHAWASVSAQFDSLKIEDPDSSLKWIHMSDYGRRGFCRACGSSLFWHGHGLDDLKDVIAVAAGALDTTDGFTLSEHIFCASKAGYYKFEDGAKTYPTWPGDPNAPDR